MRQFFLQYWFAKIISLSCLFLANAARIQTSSGNSISGKCIWKCLNFWQNPSILAIFPQWDIWKLRHNLAAHWSIRVELFSDFPAYWTWLWSGPSVSEQENHQTVIRHPFRIGLCPLVLVIKFTHTIHFTHQLCSIITAAQHVSRVLSEGLPNLNGNTICWAHQPDFVAHRYTQSGLQLANV